jgi:hypothetical protein
MGVNKVIPILGSPMVEDCLLLMFEPSDRDNLSSCGGLDELPKWLQFESLMEIAGERGRGRQGMMSVDRDRLRRQLFQHSEGNNCVGVVHNPDMFSR